jgi:LemA protein
LKTELILLVVAVATAAYLAVIYNALVRFRNLAREAWSGIDVQLRRRNDLVPMLVEVVKAYAAHERSLFEDIAHKRASSVAAGTVPDHAAAARALQGSLGRLMAVAEGYPQLKADQNFRALQDQLTEIEDQLQMARRYYNGTVRNLNTRIESFPDVLIARLLGFKEQPFFELDEPGAAAVPKIELAQS